VSYKAFKKEMQRRKPEIQSLGWPSFGTVMDAAFKAGIVRPIRKKPTAKLEYIQLIPKQSMPPPSPEAKRAEDPSSHPMPSLTTLAPQRVNPVVGLPKATEYPLEHRQVVTTMLKLMGAAPGAGIPMTELAEVLGRDFSGREGAYYLIARAEEDGILSTGEYSDPWAYLNSPPAQNLPHTQPECSRIPVQNPPQQLVATMVRV